MSTNPPVIGSIRSFDDARRALESIRNYFVALSPVSATDVRTIVRSEVSSTTVTVGAFRIVDADPTTPTKADVWYNRTENKYKGFDDTAIFGINSVDVAHWDEAYGLRHARAHALDGALDHTGITGTENNFMALSATGLPKDSGYASSSFEPTLTKGNLTASSPIVLDQTRQVIGGAAVISHATTAGNIHLPTAGATGQIITYGGASGTGAWTTATYPATTTAFKLLASTAASVIGELAAVGATGQYLAGATGAIPAWATLNQAAVDGLTTASSPTFVTVKCTGLTDGYIPYHVADATGLGNGPIFTDGTNVGIGGTPSYLVDLISTSFPKTMIAFRKVGYGDWGIVLGNEAIPNIYFGLAGYTEHFFWRANWNTAGVAVCTFQLPPLSASQGATALATVNSQLVSGQTGHVLCASSYGGTMGDLFCIQSSGKTGIGIPLATVRLEVTETNATTDAVDNIQIISHRSSGTAAAGFGSGLAFLLESSTTNDQNAARLTASWVVATHASRTARLTLSAYDSAAEREGMRIEGSGTAAMLSFFGANAVVKQTGCAVPTDLPECIAAITALRTALNNYGLTTTV